jgi:predicted small lipoprotein YifL
MLRQFRCHSVFAAVLAFAALTGISGCGIKGPLRPAPKAVVAPPPIDNPATPPATTSPALPPPASSSERRP